MRPDGGAAGLVAVVLGMEGYKLFPAQAVRFRGGWYELDGSAHIRWHDCLGVLGRRPLRSLWDSPLLSTTAPRARYNGGGATRALRVLSHKPQA